MRVTAKLLREHGACEHEVARFEKEWPNGCMITPANLAAAACLRFDLDCPACAFLTPIAWQRYMTKSLQIHEADTENEPDDAYYLSQAEALLAVIDSGGLKEEL